MTSLPYEENVPLAKLTTLKVGGPARYVVAVKTDEAVKVAGRFAEQNAQPLYVIGGGSNILASDAGYAGVILLMQSQGYQFEASDEETILVTVEAGANLDQFIEKTIEHGWWGLENLSHIPGTVGATPIQNVGAYGVEVSQLIHSVTVFDFKTKQIIKMNHDQCQFAYRDSFFKSAAGRSLIILRVTFSLSKIAKPIITYQDLVQRLANKNNLDQKLIRAEIIKIRSEKFPDWKVVGTAGSFFKNPIISASHAEALKSEYPDLPTYIQGNGLVKVSLGFILDKICGLKGWGNDRVRLYENQALVLVTAKDATANDINNFADEITTKVFSQTKIKIDTEVTKL